MYFFLLAVSFQILQIVTFHFRKSNFYSIYSKFSYRFPLKLLFCFTFDLTLLSVRDHKFASIDRK